MGGLPFFGLDCFCLGFCLYLNAPVPWLARESMCHLSSFYQTSYPVRVHHYYLLMHEQEKTVLKARK